MVADVQQIFIHCSIKLCIYSTSGVDFYSELFADDMYNSPLLF